MSVTLEASVHISQLARDLHRMGPASRKALERQFERSAQPILSVARSNASWSTRIPAAISVRSRASAITGSISVELRISAKAAPHGRPYEGLNQQGGYGGYFRHPVFGNTEAWVSQTERPYALPAVQAQGDIVQKRCLTAYETAARDCGFR